MANLYTCGFRIEHYNGWSNTGSPVYSSVTSSDSNETNNLGYVQILDGTTNSPWGIGCLWSNFINAAQQNVNLTDFWITFEALLYYSGNFTSSDLTQYGPMVLHSTSSTCFLLMKQKVAQANQYSLFLGDSLTDETNYVDLGITIQNTTSTTVPVIINLNVSGAGSQNGSITAYINGSLSGSWTGDMTNYPSFNAVSFHGIKSSGTNPFRIYYSYVTDYRTVNSYLTYESMSSVGKFTDWTGTTTNFTVNPVNYTDFTNGLYSNKTTQKESFTFGSISQTTGYVPAAVVYSTAMKMGEDLSSATIQGLIASNTSASSPTVTLTDSRTPTTSGSALVWYYTSDPVSNSSWTLANLNSYEFGVNRTA